MRIGERLTAERPHSPTTMVRLSASRLWRFAVSDIVERLRANYSDCDSSAQAHMALEASNEIQRLRDRVEGLEAIIRMVDGIMVRYKRVFETDDDAAGGAGEA